MAPRNTRRNVTVNERSGARSLVQAVDTYSRPADTRDSTGADMLAKALGFAATARVSEIERQNEIDTRLGQLEGLAMDAAQSPDAIRRGDKYAQSSNAFMAGLRESQSKAWAFKTLNSWKQEYMQWEGRNSNDPAAFQQWIAGKMKDSAESIGSDEYAIAGALPVLQQGMNNMTVEHISYTDKRVKDDELNAMRGTAVGYMENFNWDVDPTGESLVATLKAETDIRYNKGLDGKTVNTQMVDDVIDFADSRNDTRYLAALAAGHDNGTFRLNAEQQAKVEAATQSIDSELAAIEAANEAAAKKQNEAFEANQFGQYVMELQENPMAMPSAEVGRTHPKLYKQMISLRGTFNTQRTYTDPAQENAALRDVMDIFYGDTRDSTREQKFDAVMDILSTREGQFSEGTVMRIMTLLGDNTRAQSNSRNVNIKPLRDGVVGMLKSYQNVTMGETGTLQSMFEFYYDQSIMNYDLSGKTPTELRAIHDEVAKETFMQMYQSGTAEDAENLRLIAKRDSGFAAIADALGIRSFSDIEDAEKERAKEDLRRELQGLNQ